MRRKTDVFGDLIPALAGCVAKRAAHQRKARSLHDRALPHRPPPSSLGDRSNNVPIDPSPDYDASDEIEYGLDWFPWILRGVYPPPAYPPN